MANDAQDPNRECALMKVGNNATTTTFRASASALTDPAPGLGTAAEFSQKQNWSTPNWRLQRCAALLADKLTRTRILQASDHRQAGASMPATVLQVLIAEIDG